MKRVHLFLSILLIVILISIADRLIYNLSDPLVVYVIVPLSLLNDTGHLKEAVSYIETAHFNAVFWKGILPYAPRYNPS